MNPTSPIVKCNDRHSYHSGLLAVVGVGLALNSTAAPEASPAGSDEFANPILEQRADPWVYRHTDGMYYLTATVPEWDRLELRRAPKTRAPA